MEDYAFAPGKPGKDRVTNTLYDRLAHQMFDRRPNTTRIPRRRSIQCLHDFVDHLNNSPSITRPIGDVLIAGHANDGGDFFVPLHRGQKGATTYELLEDSYTDPAKEIILADATMGHTPGDPPNRYVHIKGCNIGKALPFLGNMIFAMGAAINVTAPKHFHYLYHHRHYGVFESMQYQFRAMNPTRFATRAELITALMATTPQYYDGTNVPQPDLEAWIPRTIRSTQKFDVRARLGITLGRRSTIEVEREFRVRPDRLVLRIPITGTAPGNQADQLTALDTHLGNLRFRDDDVESSFSPDHPFPAFVRQGYASKQAFLDGYTWTFSLNRRRTTLVATGIRYVYTLAIPITDRASGNLMFNFYPNDGSAHAAILTTLDTSDSRFFETA